LGVIAYARGDVDGARRRWEEGRELWRWAGDPLGELEDAVAYALAGEAGNESQA
jgi:hypothetical protein